jgi:putative membrane protein
MKKILKLLVFNLIALRLTAEIIPSISFSPGLKTILLAALALTGFEYLLKPIAKILFLPINILTLGTLRWVINVIGLYLVTLFVDGFSVSAYSFPGLNWQGLIIPAISFSLVLTYILVSFFINLVTTLLSWLF